MLTRPTRFAFANPHKLRDHCVTPPNDGLRADPSISSAQQLGVILSTLKRLLESLRPKVEAQMKAWLAGIPLDGSDGRAAFGDRFAEVTVELRAKYKNTLSAIIEKLAQNVSTQRRRLQFLSSEKEGRRLCDRCFWLLQRI